MDPTDQTALRAAGIVAVLRAPSADAAVHTVDALVRGGVTGVEVAYTTPGAGEAIGRIRERHGDGVLLGAGTVLQVEQAAEAAEAGARFLVSPGAEPVVAGAMAATGAMVVLGALTPGEVMTAQRLGSAVVKIFPASLGGPGYLRSLRGPFPDVPLMPTGGVSADDLADWFAAGAIAVGAGSELCAPAAMATGDWAAIEEAAGRYTRALRALPAELRGSTGPAPS